MRRLFLIDNWRAVLRKAWSLRLALIAAVLSAIEVLMQFLAPDRPPPWFALAAAVVSLGAGIARLFSQPRMHREDQK